jgi:hypothetical protein
VQTKNNTLTTSHHNIEEQFLINGGTNLIRTTCNTLLAIQCDHKPNKYYMITRLFRMNILAHVIKKEANESSWIDNGDLSGIYMMLCAASSATASQRKVPIEGKPPATEDRPSAGDQEE